MEIIVWRKTSVLSLDITDKGISFVVEGLKDAQVTLELEAEKEYKIFINDINVGKMKTNLGGKLVLSVELSTGEKAIKVVKA